MAGCTVKHQSLLENLQNLLDRNPDTYDIKFCVGAEKKVIRSVKILLQAASPVFERELQNLKPGQTVSLPDFDPDSFELFSSLTIRDKWTADHLTSLNLPPESILSLMSICQRFQMAVAFQLLEIMAAPFFQSFHTFKDTDDFLKISNLNLEIIFASDELPLEELEVFESACRWAESKCNERAIEPTGANLRLVLGNSLFEIRFPLLSNTEFTEAVEITNILTPEEAYGIYKSCFDEHQLPFKIKPRKKTSSNQQKPVFSEILTSAVWAPREFLTLDLTKEFGVVETPHFVCDGKEHINTIKSSDTIELNGLGFLGPIHGSGYFDITVQIVDAISDREIYPLNKKHIFAEKGKMCYFLFDTPVILDGVELARSIDYYLIFYSLKGPNTSSVNSELYTISSLEEGGTLFHFQWLSHQLAEIAFRKV